MKLSSALREKKRYVVFEILGGKFELDNFNSAFQKQAFEFLGDSEMSNAKPELIKECWKKNKGVIRVIRGFEKHVKIVLALVREIKGKKVIVFSRKISGSLKKCKSLLVN